ncbi:DUF4179 domain-containing protein [Ruminiclostridium sufflavum]|nr:DUF4179 domain-containing protein [Ruminiclostridium sufflavum]
MNDKIKAAPELITDTIDLMDNPGSRSRTRPIFRRPAAVAAAIVLCLVLATPALAANMPAIYEMMYMVSPAIAQYFVPVQEFCEDNGIRMEVVSTYIHDDTAQVYVIMQDITGDRIDADTDLFDSYSLHIPFDSMSHCEQVGFDEKTRTAKFLITISTMNGKDIAINGGKVTFSVREFLSSKVSEENIPIALELTAIGEANNLYTLGTGYNNNTYTYVGGSFIDGKSSDSYTVLIPGKAVYSLGKGMDITGIGYVDGQLHIQAMTYDKMTFDTHGDFQLVDANGSKVQYNSVCFADGMGTDNRIDYQEFIFDVSQERIGSYKLFGNYYSNGINTKGNWKVTFPLINSSEK